MHSFYIVIIFVSVCGFVAGTWEKIGEIKQSRSKQADLGASLTATNSPHKRYKLVAKTGQYLKWKSGYSFTTYGFALDKLLFRTKTSNGKEEWLRPHGSRDIASLPQNFKKLPPGSVQLTENQNYCYFDHVREPSRCGFNLVVTFEEDVFLIVVSDRESVAEHSINDNYAKYDFEYFYQTEEEQFPSTSGAIAECSIKADDFRCVISNVDEPSQSDIDNGGRLQFVGGNGMSPKDKSPKTTSILHSGLYNRLTKTFNNSHYQVIESGGGILKIQLSIPFSTLRTDPLVLSATNTFSGTRWNTYTLSFVLQGMIPSLLRPEVWWDFGDGTSLWTKTFRMTQSVKETSNVLYMQSDVHWRDTNTPYLTLFYSYSTKNDFGISEKRPSKSQYCNKFETSAQTRRRVSHRVLPEKAVRRVSRRAKGGSDGVWHNTLNIVTTDPVTSWATREVYFVPDGNTDPFSSSDKFSGSLTQTVCAQVKRSTVDAFAFVAKYDFQKSGGGGGSPLPWTYVIYSSAELSEGESFENVLFSPEKTFWVVVAPAGGRNVSGMVFDESSVKFQMIGLARDGTEVEKVVSFVFEKRESLPNGLVLKFEKVWGDRLYHWIDFVIDFTVDFVDYGPGANRREAQDTLKTSVVQASSVFGEEEKKDDGGGNDNKLELGWILGGSGGAVLLGVLGFGIYCCVFLGMLGVVIYLKVKEKKEIDENDVVLRDGPTKIESEFDGEVNLNSDVCTPKSFGAVVMRQNGFDTDSIRKHEEERLREEKRKREESSEEESESESEDESESDE